MSGRGELGTLQDIENALRQIIPALMSNRPATRGRSHTQTIASKLVQIAEENGDRRMLQIRNNSTSETIWIAYEQRDLKISNSDFDDIIPPGLKLMIDWWYSGAVFAIAATEVQVTVTEFLT